MARIKRLKHEGMEAYIFSCPGCEMEHMIPVSYTPEYLEKLKAARPNREYNYPTWKFNGSMTLPTFHPSLLNTYEDGRQSCHLHVDTGDLRFCSDSTHHLAGRTVRMPDVD